MRIYTVTVATPDVPSNEPAGWRELERSLRQAAHHVTTSGPPEPGEQMTLHGGVGTTIFLNAIDLKEA